MQVLDAHRTNRGSITKALTSTPCIATYGNILHVHPRSHIILSSAPYMAATRALGAHHGLLHPVLACIVIVYCILSQLHPACRGAHTALPTVSPALIPSTLNTYPVLPTLQASILRPHLQLGFTAIKHHACVGLQHRPRSDHLQTEALKSAPTPPPNKALDNS